MILEHDVLGTYLLSRLLTLEHYVQAKETKDTDQREMEKLQEKERIRSGKELAEMKRVEQDQERKRTLDWRKREKEEEARARAKIKVKLEEDRLDRRKKLGLPEEYTPEELAQIEAKEKEVTVSFVRAYCS